MHKEVLKPTIRIRGAWNCHIYCTHPQTFPKVYHPLPFQKFNVPSSTACQGRINWNTISHLFIQNQLPQWQYIYYTTMYMYIHHMTFSYKFLLQLPYINLCIIRHLQLYTCIHNYYTSAGLLPVIKVHMAINKKGMFHTWPANLLIKGNTQTAK